MKRGRPILHGGSSIRAALASHVPKPNARRHVWHVSSDSPHSEPIVHTRADIQLLKETRRPSLSACPRTLALARAPELREHRCEPADILIQNCRQHVLVPHRHALWSATSPARPPRHADPTTSGLAGGMPAATRRRRQVRALDPASLEVDGHSICRSSPCGPARPRADSHLGGCEVRFVHRGI
jgi:hypothetical protein